jgi:hypothetical protein
MAGDQKPATTPQPRPTESPFPRPPMDVTERGADQRGKDTRGG